jgi:ABC-type glycerol-3-phosphate transport system permease component
MTRRRVLHAVFYVALAAFAALYLLPVYMMLLTGFKSITEIDLNPVLVGRRGEGVTILDALVRL